jgi:hypothetical protein
VIKVVTATVGPGWDAMARPLRVRIGLLTEATMPR